MRPRSSLSLQKAAGSLARSTRSGTAFGIPSPTRESTRARGGVFSGSLGAASIFSNYGDNVHNLLLLSDLMVLQSLAVIRGAHSRYPPKARLANTGLDAVLLDKGKFTYMIWLEYLGSQLKKANRDGTYNWHVNTESPLTTGAYWSARLDHEIVPISPNSSAYRYRWKGLREVRAKCGRRLFFDGRGDRYKCGGREDRERRYSGQPAIEGRLRARSLLMGGGPLGTTGREGIENDT